MDSINNILSGADLELITILQNKKLKPIDIEEFFSCLNTLDEDVLSVDRILSRVSGIFRNITDYYKNNDIEKIKILISHI